MIRNLPHLTKTEVQRVRDACDAILHKAPEVVPYEEDLYCVIQDSMKSYNGSTMLPFSRFMRLQAYAKFKDDALAVNENIKLFKPESVAYRRKALMLVVSLVIQRLQQLEITITPSKLMELLHIAPNCVSRSFPGYARSGLLPLILKQSST